MLHIGTVQELYMGETKVLNKVRIGWELPTELRVFKEENGEQPLVISKEFTLSMHEKSNLRKVLASWRGQDFTVKEAEGFDITKLIGAPCMLNLIHKPSKDGTKHYEEIASITPVPRGMAMPAQVNSNSVWDYANPDWDLFNKLPDFIKEKIKGSLEYVALTTPEYGQQHQQHQNDGNFPPDDLPF